MLNILFEYDMTEEEAERVSDKKKLEFPDEYFVDYIYKGVLNSDKYFEQLVKDIDNCYIPEPGVIKDIATGLAHPISEVSTGVKMLWLMKNEPDKWLYLSHYLGENCYQHMLDLSKDRDIWLYECSRMMTTRMDGYSLDGCIGKFNDYVKSNIVEVVGDASSWITFCYDYERRDLYDTVSFEYRTDID